MKENLKAPRHWEGNPTVTGVFAPQRASNTEKVSIKETLITLYYKFICPCLCHCNHVWGNAYVSYPEKLFLMQKKIVRMIHSVKPKTHTKPLFEDAKY